jgi:ribose 5-phosphate isomerase RpiB
MDSVAKMVETFLHTPFEGGRHQGRVEAIPIPAVDELVS